MKYKIFILLLILISGCADEMHRAQLPIYNKIGHYYIGKSVKLLKTERPNIILEEYEKEEYRYTLSFNVQPSAEERLKSALNLKRAEISIAIYFYTNSENTITRFEVERIAK